jgi:hypothetical protein
MKTTWLCEIIPLLYFLFTGFVFASELYTLIYDRGNSEMAGLGSYLLTTPSSFLIEWIANLLFAVKIGTSDTAFTVILGLSVILNTALLYLIMIVLLGLGQRITGNN